MRGSVLWKAAAIGLSHFRYGLLSWKDPSKNQITLFSPYGYIRREYKNPTGLYYLLRDGPALAGQVGLVSDGSGRLLSSSDHAVVGDSGHGETREQPSLKRKFVIETTSTESVAKATAAVNEKASKRSCV